MPMPMTPIAVDLCCGLGGWTAGLLAEGYRVVGFDIARPKSFPAGALFVQQDVATIDGRAWRGRVALLVASPPCTEFSQCWRFARHRKPDPEAGMVLVRHCFRIAREFGGPFVLENVQGARPFFAKEFGAPTWKCGSFYFWGAQPVLRPHGRYLKGIWNTFTETPGVYRYQRNRSREKYNRDPAERARIPMEIARAVAAQAREGALWVPSEL